MDVIVNVSQPVKYSYVTASTYTQCLFTACGLETGTLGDNSRRKGSRRKATKGPQGKSHGEATETHRELNMSY